MYKFEGKEWKNMFSAYISLKTKENNNTCPTKCAENGLLMSPDRASLS